jgi:hypothetical protein
MLDNEETLLNGSWIVSGATLVPDEVCRRIEALTSGSLRKVADSPRYGSWEVLYVDPRDGRYWKKSYPQGHLHGGGPPRLENISRQQAAEQFDLS